MKNVTKETTMTKDKLTPKQSRFVEEYLVDLNQTQSAIRAGYSEKTAAEQASRLLTKAKVQAAVQELMAKRSGRTQIMADNVVTELAKIGFADIRKAVVWGATPDAPGVEGMEPNGLNIYPVALVPSSVIDDDTAAAVAEVSLTQAGIKIKMYDKKSALDSLGKHLGLFTNKLKVTGKNGGAIETSEVPASVRLREMLDRIAPSQGGEQ